MKLIKIVVNIIALLMVPIVSWAACTGSSPTWTSTVDRSSVAICVSQASAGDTIYVSAGSATWSSAITVNKGISIIGAGVGQTVITRGGTRIFSISDPNNSNLLRISGFTFKVSSGTEGGGIAMNCSDTSPKYNIRIDNNLFTTPFGTCSTGHCFIKNNGCRGVIDNNTFENASYPFGVGLAGDFPGDTAWENLPELVFGTANDNIYVEDNIINDSTTALSDCDEGGRYVFRYNTITPGSDMWPFLDSHGGKGGVYSCMGVEIYGNQFNGTGKVHDNQYAARSTAHHNYVSGSGGIEISDAEGCPQLEIERLNDTYYFLNRYGSLSGSLITTSTTASTSCGGNITENEEYWQDNSSFIYPNTGSNITTGVGCGPLDNRPTSCTTGTAYWATNQSCSDLTGMVGVNPATPIDGTLYKCTSTNEWTVFYAPLTYPHPLRKIPPNPPKNLRILSQQ